MSNPSDLGQVAPNETGAKSDAVKASSARGLGRGLSSLLGDPLAARPSGNVESGQGVEKIDIDLIHPNPNQPRRSFDAAELATLADSIRAHGLLQPILLRPSTTKTGQFEIIAGERRWRATQMAGIRKIEAVVRSFDDMAMLEAAIVENLQRVDLNPIDEALAYRQLIDRYGKTQQEVADQIGKSRAHIANILRLLSLPVGVQQLVSAGQLSSGHARTLVGVDDALSLAQMAIEKNMSVRALEQYLAKQDSGPSSKPSGKQSQKPRAKNADADIAALEADLSANLGLDVSISHGPGHKGQLLINYTSLESLDDLCSRLTRARG